MMHLYDTAAQALLEFPHDHDDIHMYVCGITPYDAAHIGHIFTFITYDLLQRRLEDLGHTVKLVRNITDVDEPIFARAKENGEDYRVLAERETAAFQSVLRTLNFRTAYAEPKASEYVPQMAAAVNRLLEAGAAYRLEADIYFDASRAQQFGTPSHFSPRLQRNFMADRGGDVDRPGKRQPLDFLLWKGVADPQDPAAWDSPVGRGRPGWHIECSVMSTELLGTPMDLHGGGMDLIFPHHACEVAQSEALGRRPFTNHWLHVAPLLHSGEKMSKSLGNLVFAKDLLAVAHPAAIRLALMRYHYRTGGEWRDDTWENAKELVKKLQLAVTKPRGNDPQPYLEEVRAALDDDLNTHDALCAVKNLAKSLLQGTGHHPEAAAGLRQILELLGINL